MWAFLSTALTVFTTASMNPLAHGQWGELVSHLLMPTDCAKSRNLDEANWGLLSEKMRSGRPCSS